MKKILEGYRYSIWLCLWGILGLFSQFSYAAPDIVAQNYASARSPGIQSCTVGYDLMAGDVSYGQSFINGALPYSLNYRAPLRQNLSAAQTFSQPESSSLGWTDNYQAHVFVQNITSTTTENTQYTVRQVGTNPVRYELTTKTPVTRANISAKQIWIRLPGESTDTVFKEENGSFTRLYSADAVRELNNNSIQSLLWYSDLGEYQLSRSGDNLIIAKNGVKYTVSSNSYTMSPQQTYTDKVNVYLDNNYNLKTTNDSWHFFSFGIPADAISNTDLLIKTETTVSIQLYRVTKIENQGRVLNLQYDNNMNLTQVSDVYNNKLLLEHNFHDASTGASQTIDESRLVTKVTYLAAQGGSQVATFNYRAYVNKVPSTGANTTVFALINSDSTAAGVSSYVNEMTEIGAIKAYVASKGRTADSSYYYPVLRQVKNALGQIVRQWEISQNYVLSGTNYSTAQTTLRSYTPLASGTSQDFITVYNDIAKTINLTLQLNSGTTSSVVQSTVNSDNSLTITASGYPCLTSNGKPVTSAEFATAKSRLVKVVDGNNIAATYEYDPQNRIIRIIDAVGTVLSRTTNYVYGVLNNNSPNFYLTPTNISIANLTISNVVNPRGQIVTQTQTSSQSGSTSKNTSYAYEENVNSPHFARMLSVDGPRSGTADKTDYTYDNYGYLASQSLFINGATRTTQYLGYNVFGQPERIVSPNGMVEQFIYNIDGTLKQKNYGIGGATGTISGQIEKYTYDGLKQLKTTTNADNEVTSYEYDNAGRLIKATLPNGSINTKTYHANGVLYTDTNRSNDGSTIFKSITQLIDNNGRVSRIWNGISDGWYWTDYRYDMNGNLAESQSRLGVINKWRYDALNRVTQFIDGNGDVHTQDYDVNDNPISIKDPLNAGSAPLNYRNGNVLTSEQNSDFGTKTYRYNEADQLTQRLHGFRECNFLNIDEAGRAQRQECKQIDPSPSRGYDDKYIYDQTRFGRLDQVVGNSFGTDTSYYYDNYDRVTQKIRQLKL